MKPACSKIHIPKIVSTSRIEMKDGKPATLGSYFASAMTSMRHLDITREGRKPIKIMKRAVANVSIRVAFLCPAQGQEGVRAFRRI